MKSSLLRSLLLPALALAFAAQGACSSEAPAKAGPVARFELSGGKIPDFFAVPWPSDAYLKDGRIMDPIPGFDAVVTQNGDVDRARARRDGRLLAHHARALLGRRPVAAEGRLGRSRSPPRSTRRRCRSTRRPARATRRRSSSSTSRRPTPRSARVPLSGSAFQDDRDIGSEQAPRHRRGPRARRRARRRAPVRRRADEPRARRERSRGVAASASFSRSRRHADPVAKLYQDALAKAEQLLARRAAGHAHRLHRAVHHAHARARDVPAPRDARDDPDPAALVRRAGRSLPMGAARFAKLVRTAAARGLHGEPRRLARRRRSEERAPRRQRRSGTTSSPSARTTRSPRGAPPCSTRRITSRAGRAASTVPGQDHFARDASGNIVQNPTRPTYKIWVSIAVPDAPMPAGGYPTVIVQHGMGASREYFVQVANVFCSRRAGWSSASTASPSARARSSRSTRSTDDRTT